jgi:KUP system potassium uptake protein
MTKSSVTTTALPGVEAAKKGLFAMMLLAIGVVYGDIGTSPLYTLEVTMKAFGGNFTTDDIYGVVSLITWCLFVFVTCKYIIWVMRADNAKQGGVLALVNLLQTKKGRAYVGAFTIVGIFATGLMIADGCITPAVSVLSAMEGLQTVWPSFNRFFIIVATMVVLGGLFSIQSRGTDRIGNWFGPIMCLWFGTIGLIGFYQVSLHPEVLWALNPYYAVKLFVNHALAATVLMGIIGGVFLAMTGGEALYADMGHLGGRRPIAWSFPTFVLPALVLNYLGQAALIANNHGIEKPFFEAIPPVFGLGVEPVRLAMTILATVATVIASQALISGAFSLAYQAIQMSFLTRQRIVHKSSHEINQVYAPSTNTMLMVGSMALVWFFQTSDNLAAAYGLAVSGTMLATTYLRYLVSVQVFNKAVRRALIPAVCFGVGDIIFVGSNSLKIPEGGWLPLLGGLIFGFLMLACLYGNRSVRSELKRLAVPVAEFMRKYAGMGLAPRQGVGIILSKVTTDIPYAVENALENGFQLFSETVIYSVVVDQTPKVGKESRYEYEFIASAGGVNFHRVVAHFGYMQRLHVSEVVQHALRHAGEHKVKCVQHPRLFIAHETLRRRPRTNESFVSYWLKHPCWLAFWTMKQLADDVTDWFGIKERDCVTRIFKDLEIDYAHAAPEVEHDPLTDVPHPIAVG